MTVFNVGDVLGTQESFCLKVEDIVTGRTFIASITRWGKSWTTRKIVESCVGHAGIIIFDQEGEYSSLREKFPFLIIGKDVPLQLETAEFMAEKMLENKINVIVDTSMVEDEETAKEYINLFLRKFFFLETTQRQPYLVVVEEAEDIAGEKGIGTQTCLGIMINIVKKGGKRGIGALFIAHRPAWISKGILSQCSNKAIGKIESTDFEALEKYARVPSDVIERLPTLNKGEFCFVGDWVEKTTFVKVGQVQTTHLGFTPGLIPPSPKELQSVILNLQANLKAFVEKVKPSLPDVDTLRKDAETKAEAKAAERIKKETQKLEEKYKERISALEAEVSSTKKRLELVSQTASLSSSSVPLNNVLDHPVVKNNLEKLAQRDERGKNLLLKIQHDTENKHYPTKEESAAFLSVSTDTVKRLVDVINEVFHATAVLGEGKPLQYRSLLQRLYITDVARREIERIEELQREKGDLEQTVNGLKANISDLKTENSKLKTYTAPEVTAALRSELADMREKCKQATPEMLQGLKIKVADLEAKLKEATKKLTEAERLNSYFLRNFKVLKGVFLEFNSLFGEVDAGYQKIIAEKQAQTPIEEKQETPVAAESAKEAAVIPVQVQPGTQKVEPNISDLNSMFPHPTSEQHQKVLSFLKNRPGKEFSAFELSLALDVPEQAVCEAIHVFDSEITVSPNGLSVKGNMK